MQEQVVANLGSEGSTSNHQTRKVGFSKKLKTAGIQELELEELSLNSHGEGSSRLQSQGWTYPCSPSGPIGTLGQTTPSFPEAKAAAGSCVLSRQASAACGLTSTAQSASLPPPSPETRTPPQGRHGLRAPLPWLWGFFVCSPNAGARTGKGRSHLFSF